MLKVERLTKTYPTAGGALAVLREVSFDLERGASLAIVGPSGSGKTTLLGLCAGLDDATGGTGFCFVSRLRTTSPATRRRTRTPSARPTISSAWNAPHGQHVR